MPARAAPVFSRRSIWPGSCGAPHPRPAQRIAHLHAHFAHDPTLIALLVHRLTGISYSFTGHARDLYQIPVPALVERIAEADAVVTCCGANLHYLAEVAPQVAPGKVRLIPHGVDLRGFQPAAPTRHRQRTRPLILSVGRLVEKKGFPDLLHACGLLKQRGYAFPLRDLWRWPFAGGLGRDHRALGVGG